MIAQDLIYVWLINFGALIINRTVCNAVWTPRTTRFKDNANHPVSVSLRFCRFVPYYQQGKNTQLSSSMFILPSREKISTSATIGHRKANSASYALSSLLRFNLATISAFCSSVSSRFALYGFFPNRNGYSGHSGITHSATSFDEPLLHSRQYTRIALTGFCRLAIFINLAFVFVLPETSECNTANILFAV